jgi:hypothetical protein
MLQKFLTRRGGKKQLQALPMRWFFDGDSVSRTFCDSVVFQCHERA